MLRGLLLCVLGEHEVVLPCKQAGEISWGGRSLALCAACGVGHARQTSEQRAGSSNPVWKCVWSSAKSVKHGKGDQGPCVENWKEPGGLYAEQE